MPRKPKADATVELAQLPATVTIPRPVAEPPKTPTEERRERELEEILEGLATDSRITVYHLLDGKGTYAGVMSADGFSLEALLDAYGGGDKSLVIYQGSKKVETVRVSLDPSVPPTSPRAKALPKAVAGAAPGATSLTEVATVLASMAQMTAQSAQLSQQMMTGMVTAMTGMVTAMQSKEAPNPTAQLVELAKILKPDAADRSSASELFNAFDKGISIAAKLGGDDGDGTLGVIKEGLAVVGKVVERQQNAGLARPGPVPRLPATAPGPDSGSAVLAGGANGAAGGSNGTGAPAAAPAAAAGAAPTPAVSAGAAAVPAGGNVTRRPWVEAAAPFVPMLGMFAGKWSPELGAANIGESLTEDELNDLLDDIDAGTVDEFVTRVQGYFWPGMTLAPHVREWFTQVAGALLASVEDVPAAGDPVDEGPGAPP